MTIKMSKAKKEKKIGDIEKSIKLLNLSIPKIYYQSSWHNTGHCSLCGSDLVKMNTSPNSIVGELVCPIHKDDKDFRRISREYFKADIVKICFTKVDDDLVITTLHFDYKNKEDIRWKISRAFVLSGDGDYTLKINGNGEIIKESEIRYPQNFYSHSEVIGIEGLFEMEDLVFKSGLAEILIGSERKRYEKSAYHYAHIETKKKEAIKDIKIMSQEEKAIEIKDIIAQNPSLYVYNIIELAIAYKNGINLEKLAKSELLSIAVNIFEEMSFRDKDYIEEIIKSEERKLNRSLGAPLDMIKDILELYHEVSPAYLAKIIKDLYQKVNNKEEILSFFNEVYRENLYSYRIGNITDEAIFLLDNGYKMKDIISYIQRADRYQALSPSDTIHYLRDYVNMSKELEMKYIKYPKDLRLKHDLLAREHRFKIDEITNKKFKNVVDENKKFEFKDTDFIIKAPDSPEDVMREGRDQSHCVASYIRSIANKECSIVFLRKKEREEEAFATIEISSKNVVRQVKCRFNEELKDIQAKKFLQKWAKEKNLKYI